MSAPPFSIASATSASTSVPSPALALACAARSRSRRTIDSVSKSPGNPDMFDSRLRTVGGRAGGFPLSVIPLNSGRYFSTGSSSASLPRSTRIISSVAVTGLELDAICTFWSTFRLP